MSPLLSLVPFFLALKAFAAPAPQSLSEQPSTTLPADGGIEIYSVILGDASDTAFGTFYFRDLLQGSSINETRYSCQWKISGHLTGAPGQVTEANLPTETAIPCGTSENIFFNFTTGSAIDPKGFSLNVYHRISYNSSRKSSATPKQYIRTATLNFPSINTYTDDSTASWQWVSATEATSPFVSGTKLKYLAASGAPAWTIPAKNVPSSGLTSADPYNLPVSATSQTQTGELRTLRQGLASQNGTQNVTSEGAPVTKRQATEPMTAPNNTLAVDQTTGGAQFMGLADGGMTMGLFALKVGMFPEGFSQHLTGQFVDNLAGYNGSSPASAALDARIGFNDSPPTATKPSTLFSPSLFKKTSNNTNNFGFRISQNTLEAEDGFNITVLHKIQIAPAGKPKQAITYIRAATYHLPSVATWNYTSYTQAGANESQPAGVWSYTGPGALSIKVNATTEQITADLYKNNGAGPGDMYTLPAAGPVPSGVSRRDGMPEYQKRSALPQESGEGPLVTKLGGDYQVNSTQQEVNRANSHGKVATY